ncbi:hypothetical protein MIR68_010899 [Amoeboaphelidium protococcarum]|nr:hypothetical protein MIR68_010899 [Amoeboaphelidium protococcarum]
MTELVKEQPEQKEAVMAPQDYTGDPAANALVSSYIGNVKISGVICAAVFAPMLIFYLLKIVGLQLNFLSTSIIGILIVSALSGIIRKEIETYKRLVRVELQRQQGLRQLDTDIESAEWLNLILGRFWLIFEPVISDIVTGSVNQILDQYTPSFIDSIGLSEFTLGTVAPRLANFRGITKTDDDIIRFDCDAIFEPKDSEDLVVTKDERNSKIVLSTRIGKGVMGVEIPVLVKNIGFSAQAQIELQTMQGFPFVKIVKLQLPQHPSVQFVLKPLKGMDLMDLPGLNAFLQTLIRDIVGMLFVHPNAFVLDLDAIMNGDYVVGEQAIGILLIKVYEARGLKNMESFGVSDPFAKVKIGGKEVARTKIIDNNLNPYFNESFYVIVHSLNDTFELGIYDKDLIKDSMMGSYKSTLAEFGLDQNPKTNDMWKPLSMKESRQSGKDSKSSLPDLSMPSIGGKGGKSSKGDVRFELSFYPLPSVEQVADAAQQLTQDASRSANQQQSAPSAGVLRVTVHQLKELDTKRTNIGVFSPYVEVLHFGNVVFKSKVVKRKNNPSFEQTFQLFIRDTTFDQLKFVAYDHRELSNNVELGDCVLTLNEIIKNLNKKTNKIEWWSLRNVNSGQIRLSFQFTPVEFDHAVPHLSLTGKNIALPAIGVLRVKVIEALDLKNAQNVGISDPYVNIVYAGMIRAKTDIIESSLEPMWNETHYILVQDDSLKGKLFFEIFDFNNLQKDKKMGDAEFDLKQLESSNTKQNADASSAQEFWIPVTLSKKQAGSLRVELSFHRTIVPKAIEDVAESAAPLADGSAKDVGGTKIIESSNNVASTQLSNIDDFRSGILSIEIEQIELDKATQLKNEDDIPEPYLEFYDSTGSIYSNEIASLYEYNTIAMRNAVEGSKSTLFGSIRKLGGSAAKGSNDLDSLMNSLQNKNEAAIKNARNFVLVERKLSNKKGLDVAMDEQFELFVTDVESASLLVVCKDYARPKGLPGVAGLSNVSRIISGNGNKKELKGSPRESDSEAEDEPKKVERAQMLMHPILGKNEILIKDLLQDVAKQQSQAVIVDTNEATSSSAAQSDGQKTVNQSLWRKLVSIKSEGNPISGRFKIKVNFKPVPLNEDQLYAEQLLWLTNSGNLSVNVMEGHNLPAVDTSGSSDPFVVLKLNSDKSVKTKVVKKNNKNPRYNETFNFELKNRAASRLYIEVYDWNQFEGNKLMGYIPVDCSKFLADESQEVQLALLDEDSGEPLKSIDGLPSTLQLKFTFKPDAKLAAFKRRRPKNKNLLQNTLGTAVISPMNDAVGLISGTALAAQKMMHFKRSNKEKKKAEGAMSITSVASSYEFSGQSDTEPPVVDNLPAKQADAPLENAAGKNVGDLQKTVPEPSALAPIGGLNTSLQNSTQSLSENGTLLVTVVECMNLKAVDKGGSSDPFVKVKFSRKEDQNQANNQHSEKRSLFHGVGSSKDVLEKVHFKTKHVKKNLNPVFNEQFVLPVSVKKDDGLMISLGIRDHNTFGNAVDIGDLQLDVWQLFANAQHESENLQVVDFTSTPGQVLNGGNGQIRVKLEYRAGLAPSELSPRSRFGSNASLSSGGGMSDEMKKSRSFLSGKN